LNNIFNILGFQRKHVKFLFALAAAVLISTNIVSYMNTDDFIENKTDILNLIRNLEILEDLRDKINDAETGRNFYFVTRDKENLKPFHLVSNSIDTIYSKLRLRFKDSPVQLVNLDTLSLLVRLRFDLFSRSIELQERKGTSTQVHKTFNDKGNELQNGINTLIIRMKNEEFDTLKKNSEIAGSKAQFTIITMAAGTVISILILAFSFILFRHVSSAGYTDPSSHKLTPDELEALIRDRTAEISQLNIRLYSQIDKLKQTEAALRRSEKDLRGVFELAHDAILIILPDEERIMDVNRRACEIYDIGIDDFVGLSLKSISKNMSDTKQYLRETLEKGYVYNYQSVHYNKDGNEMLMEINASVINYKGKTAILSINRDITDRILSYIPLPGS
jgi:PAS domain S-box-containing protein